MTTITLHAPSWLLMLLIVLGALTVLASLVTSVLNFKIARLRRQARRAQRGRMCFWCGEKHTGRCTSMPHNYNPPPEDE
jgi:hypothetical protein